MKEKKGPQTDTADKQENFSTKDEQRVEDDAAPVECRAGNEETNDGVTSTHTVGEEVPNDTGDCETGFAEAESSTEVGITEKKSIKSKIVKGTFILLVISLGIYVYFFVTQPKPPSEDVVATYNGKNLTKSDLTNYIISKGYKEEEHGFCEKHGLDHSQCDKLEECETHPIHSMEAYTQIIKTLAVENMVDNWAKEKGTEQKDEVKHDLKHLVEEVNLESLVAKVHQEELSPDKIDKWEIQKYYDQNKETYKDKPFSEVEGEIRNVLATLKEKLFFPQYIEQLKKEAALTVNYDILKVEDPSDSEMRMYYENNKGKFIEPQKVKILEIKIDISNSEEDTRKKAEEAMTKIRSGETFEDVAKMYSPQYVNESYYVRQGEKSSAFEDKIFNLQLNEISPVFKDGNSFYITKVIEKQDKRQKLYGEVLNEVKPIVTQEKEVKQYELKKTEILYSIHGKRYTLFEFLEEFKELSPEIRSKFTGFETKKGLIDELIAKQLLLEEVGDDVSDKESQENIEGMKNRYIRQMLHKEEVDEKIAEITDDEAKKLYDEKKEKLVEAPKAKIRLIRIEQGASDTENSRARQRIDEALGKLKSGADFAAIAKEYSDDYTASAGGELKDWVYDDEHLDPVLQNVIFKLQPNQTSEVFEYQNGYYVVRLEQRADKRQQTFEELKEQIKELLMEEKHNEKSAALEKELLKKSNLVIYKSTLKQLLKEQQASKTAAD